MFCSFLTDCVLSGAAVAWSKIDAIEERHKFSHFCGIRQKPQITPTHRSEERRVGKECINESKKKENKKRYNNHLSINVTDLRKKIFID